MITIVANEPRKGIRSSESKEYYGPIVDLSHTDRNFGRVETMMFDYIYGNRISVGNAFITFDAKAPSPSVECSDAASNQTRVCVPVGEDIPAYGRGVCPETNTLRIGVGADRIYTESGRIPVINRTD